MEYCFDPSIKWHYDYTMTDYFLSHQKRICSHSFLYLLPCCQLKVLIESFHWMWSWEHFCVLQLSSAQINFGYVSARKIAHENRQKKHVFHQFSCNRWTNKIKYQHIFLRRHFLLVYEYDVFPSVLELLSTERKLKSILRLSVFFHFQIFLKEEMCVCMYCERLFREMIAKKTFFLLCSSLSLSFILFHKAKHFFFCYFGLSMA